MLPGQENPTTQAPKLQNKIQHSGSENENAAASRHFQDFHRHRDLTTDHRYHHDGPGFAKNVTLRALFGSIDEFIVNE